MKIVTLNCDDSFIQGVLKGSEREVSIDVNPVNEDGLIQLDAEGYYIEDEDGNALPVKYDAVRLQNKDNEENLIVKVVDTNVTVYYETDKWDDGEAKRYLAGKDGEAGLFLQDKDGNFLRDEDGNLTETEEAEFADFFCLPKGSEDGVELNRTVWYEYDGKQYDKQMVTFTIGQVLENNTSHKTEDSGKKILSLIIKQQYFDAIMAGRKVQEFREIRPTNSKKLVRVDADGCPLRDEEDFSTPIIYDAIRFFVGYNKDRDSALVAVNSEYTKITCAPLKHEDGTPIYYEGDGDGNLVNYKYEDGDWVLDAEGKRIPDAAGIPYEVPAGTPNAVTCEVPLTYEYKGKDWVVETLVFELGRILEADIKPKKKG